LGELFLTVTSLTGVCRGGDGVIETVGVALRASEEPQEGQKRAALSTSLPQAEQLIVVGGVYHARKILSAQEARETSRRTSILPVTMVFLAPIPFGLAGYLRGS
jgi:hypothetical protein